MIKRIICLALVFCFLKGNSQMTLTGSGSSFSGTSAVTSRSQSMTFDAGALYLWVVSYSGLTTTPTVTGTTSTWNLVSNVTGITTGVPDHSLSVFRYYATSSFTETVTATFGGTCSGYYHQLFKVTGADVTGTNGANAIVQAVTAATNSQSPSITMSSISNPANTVFMTITADVNPYSGGTWDAGYGGLTAVGYTTPDRYIINGYDAATTDNTPTYTKATTTNWVGIAIELKAQQTRRIITIN
jgi:hypothetical protein